MLDRLFALETLGIKLGLDNITRLCAALGHPERRFAALHVAGTNGKGSVTAMAHAALVAAGLRAARYTSPHLSDLRERFVVGDAPVEAAALEAAASDVLDCAERLQADGAMPFPPTFFEATTAIAFELFRRAGVEVAVIEVGLGGRFDATNVLTPQVGAITSIGLDHQIHLGSTLGAIAFEKAGIIKPGMTIVTGALPAEAAAVVERAARERGAHLIDARSEADVRADLHEGRATVTIATPEDRYGPVTLALRGEHQVGNALVAVRTLEAARQSGIAIGRDAIERGLTSADWPARLELLTQPDGRQVLIDAAHNPEGAAALAAYLRKWHPEMPSLVVGVMRDKDIDGILRALLPVTGGVVATAADTPRALPAPEVAQRVLAIDPSRDVRAESNPVQAVHAALAGARLVCVAGSIVVAGAVRDALKGRAILQ